MAVGKSIIFLLPLNETLVKVKEQLEQEATETGHEIYETDDIKEVIQIVPTIGGQCLLITSSPRKCALLLNTAKKLIKRYNTKIILLSAKKMNKRTVDKLLKFGVTDIIFEPVKERTIQYKIKLLISSLKTKEQPKEMEVKSLETKSPLMKSVEESGNANNSSLLVDLTEDENSSRSNPAQTLEERTSSKLSMLMSDEQEGEQESDNSTFNPDLEELDEDESNLLAEIDALGETGPEEQIHEETEELQLENKAFNKDTNPIHVEIENDDSAGSYGGMINESSNNQLGDLAGTINPSTEEDLGGQMAGKTSTGADVIADKTSRMKGEKEELSDMSGDVNNPEAAIDGNMAGEINSEQENIDGQMSGRNNYQEKDSGNLSGSLLESLLEDEPEDNSSNYQEAPIENLKGETQLENRINDKLQGLLAGGDDDESDLDGKGSTDNISEDDMEGDVDGTDKIEKFYKNNDPSLADEEQYWGDKKSNSLEDEKNKKKSEKAALENGKKSGTDIEENFYPGKKKKDYGEMDYSYGKEEENSLENEKAKKATQKAESLLENSSKYDNDDYYNQDRETKDDGMDYNYGRDAEKERKAGSQGSKEIMLENNNSESKKALGYEFEVEEGTSGPIIPEYYQDDAFDLTEPIDKKMFDSLLSDEKGKNSKDSISYTDILDSFPKSDRKEVWIENLDLRNDQLRRIRADINAKLKEEEDAKKVILPETHGLEFCIEVSRWIHKEVAIEEEFLRYLSEIIFKRTKGIACFYQFDGRWFNELYIGHQSLFNDVELLDQEGNWNELKEQYFAKWQSETLPYWKDEKFETMENFYFYPFFEGRDLLGFVVIDFQNGPDPEHIAAVEVMVTMAKFFFLGDVFRLSYSKEDEIDESTKSFLDKVFKRKAG